MASPALTAKTLPLTVLFQGLLLFSTAVRAQPRVAQFSPSSGPIGTVVTITGTGFSANAADDIVYFGAVRSTVTAASATSLTVLAPAGATFQPMSVTVNHLTGYSAAPFVETFPAGHPFVQPVGAGQQDAFEPEIDSTTDLHPNGVAVADFDGDGRPDIATANNYSTTGQTSTLSLLRNTGGIAHLSFAAHYDLPAGVEIYAIASGDLDGDGRPDLVSSSVVGQAISVFQNTSSPGALSFAAKTDYPTGHDPFSIAIADFDLDGRPDVVVANYLSGTVSVYRNTSTGGTISLAAPMDITVGLGPQSVATGDFDGDGKNDIVVSNELSNTLALLRNTSTAGSIGFASPVSLGTNSKPYGVAVGDLDGDGKPDIAVVNNGAANYSIFRNTSGGAGSLSFAAHIDFGCGAAPYGIALGDLNGDGKPDVFTSSMNAAATQNASTPGTIAMAGKIFFYTRFPAFGIGIADLDGDGKSDLIAPGFTVDQVAILRNKDNEPSITYFSPKDGVAGTVVTINGYHFDEGITGVSFGGVPAAAYTIVSPNVIQATVGNGASGSVGVTDQYGTNLMAAFAFHAPPVVSQFAPAKAGRHDTLQLKGVYFTGATAVSFGGTSAASFVVNSDSSITAIVDSGSSGSVQVTTAYGSGSLAGFVFYPVPSIAGFTPSSGNTGTTITITGNFFLDVSAVVIGGVPAASFAVNSPTRITAVVSEGGSGYLTVTSPGGIGSSDSIFAFPPVTIGSIGPNPAAAGSSVTITGSHFRSDPSADIVFFGAARAVVTAASPTSLTVTVPPGASYAPVSVTVNNRTATGKDFFAVTYPPGGAPLTDSTFVYRGAFGTGDDPEYAQLADFNGDGKPDAFALIHPNQGGAVSVLVNNSTINHPSFSHVVTLTPPNTGSLVFSSMLAADINGDGKPDILTSSSGYFSVFLNTSIDGQISFGPQQDFAGDYWTGGLAVGDFDGDGRVDVVGTTTGFNGTQSTLSFFRNTGDGGKISFAPPVNYLLPALGGPNVVADLDKDGKPDIINVGEQTSFPFRNTSSPGQISFSPAGQLATNILETCGVADIDGDGLPDLVIEAANIHNDSLVLSVFRNTSVPGSIAFAPEVDFPYPPGKRYNQGIGMEIGQIDGDGIPDLVMVNIYADNPLVLSAYRNTSGNGTISFTGGNRYSSALFYGSARNAAIADVDGDGKPDIVLSGFLDDAVLVYRNQAGEKMVTVCAGSDTVLTSEKAGSLYRWQVGVNGAFVNLTDGVGYSGTGTGTLQLHSIPSGADNDQYRCMVDGVAGIVFDLSVNPDTLLTSAVFAPANACSGDSLTVVWYAGGSVPDKAGVEFWTSTDGGPYVLAAKKTYPQATPLFFGLWNNAATGMRYFCRVIPPSGVSGCMLPTNSDTVSTAITQLPKPVVSGNGNILQVTNADATEAYTWQRLDSTGAWVNANSGIRDTVAQSGTYRVQAAVAGCVVSSDTVKYVSATSTTGLPADSASIRGYPNPAHTVFILDSLRLTDEWVTLEIIELQSGRRISIQSIANQTRVVVPVASLNAGVYLAVLRNKNGSSVTIKFLKI